jgi:potassium efflux system protein
VTLGALLASIVVFGLGYAGARLFQGWLDAQVLQPAGISGGVRQSIRTGVGYVGIMVAALAAFSYAGFNLSSLAIVAGALSVGIGFGLQNLINNFVSGLILLAERPIRVGDRVVVGGEEGFVRKISVRSTELETYDGATATFRKFDHFRSTTTTLSRRSRSSGTTTAKPDGHTRRKRRSATVFTSKEMPSLTSTRILSLQPSRHFCRSLMVVGSYRVCTASSQTGPVAGRHFIRTMPRAAQRRPGPCTVV